MEEWEAGMTRQLRSSESLRSIAGGMLVGLGLHILFGNLDRAAVPLRHALGTTAGEGLGIVPSVVLATSQAAQAYGFHHQSFLGRPPDFDTALAASSRHLRNDIVAGCFHGSS